MHLLKCGISQTILDKAILMEFGTGFFTDVCLFLKCGKHLVSSELSKKEIFKYKNHDLFNVFLVTIKQMSILERKNLAAIWLGLQLHKRCQ
jgi:hypothetical protein